MKDKEEIFENIKRNIAISNLENELNSGDDNEYTSKNNIWLFYRLKRTIIAVIAIFMIIPISALAYELLFSSLNGDDLSLKGEYLGNGIISVYVENKSNKKLNFENSIKIVKWSTNEELDISKSKIVFNNTSVDPKTSKIMTIDISKAYDIKLLEKPLEDNDHYYLVLTNNNFAHGQDWHCSILFNQEQLTEKTEQKVETIEDDKPINIVNTSTNGEILEELKPYFDEYFYNFKDRNNKIDEYYRKANEVLGKEYNNGKNIIMNASPYLLINEVQNVTFDTRVPQNLQYQLIWQTYSNIDGFNVPIGSSEVDEALQLSVIISQKQKDITGTGGITIPIFYIYQYNVNDIKQDNSYVFVRGRLLSIKDIDKYKVYEDSQYVCYDFTDFFYSNLEDYIKTYTKIHNDVYVDDGIMTRINNVHKYLKNKDNISKLFYYHR